MTPKELAKRDGESRIEAFREHKKRYFVSDYQIRKIISAKSKRKKFDHIQFQAGSIVTSTFATGVWLIVGHGYTGKTGHERGCYGCKITDRIHKRWRWIGPESAISLDALGIGGGDTNTNSNEGG